MQKILFFVINRVQNEKTSVIRRNLHYLSKEIILEKLWQHLASLARKRNRIIR